ncbi:MULTISPECIES: nucleotidyltransferase domain-containing protein [unclassified Leifsonia]|uniref:nucleotidyltransferase domain-containing protein n=1 Tax=unclassified Leifsonia TaxID=2663824 RepID=UPI0010EAFD62|nr:MULTISPECIES: nucleotidyltransferase domain-containing protein [unclassified Leifsonia]TDP99353.1 nucleotidyltransferase-like protein [Leifsonia sp. 115AMFTsu3.1]
MSNVPQVFLERAELSEARLKSLTDRLPVDNLGQICVYATGSIARGEANEHSDLDIFLVDTADESRGELRMSKLDATLLKADLIRASRDAGFPRFSGDGIHLEVHSSSDLVRQAGYPVDDYNNTFTARLLLLLESRVIANSPAHARVAEHVIDMYWRDYPQNSKSFLPVFLVNDIMRYWKTLCLNYESQRLGGMPSGYDAERWRRRNQLRNIKLKFSRLWMCHSTIAYLLWKSAGGAPVAPDDVRHMLPLSPLQRMLEIRDGCDEPAIVDAAVENYAWFLENFAGSKEDSYSAIADKSFWIEARARGAEFAESMGGVLAYLGRESALYRFLLV